MKTTPARWLSGVALILATVAAGRAGDYVYRGDLKSTTFATNAWADAATWSGGPASFPNGVGDRIRVEKRVPGDRGLLLGQRIVLGNLQWDGSVLRLQGQPAEWVIASNSHVGVHVPMELKTDLVVRGNTIEFTENVTGAGALRLEWDQRNAERAYDMVWRSRGGNTFAGLSLKILNPARSGGRLLVIGPSILGQGDVKLDEHTELVLEGQPRDSMMGDGAGLYLTATTSSCSKVRLPNGLRETIKRLYINGQPQYAGTYGCTGSGADFIFDEHFLFEGRSEGRGVLAVAEGPLPPGALADPVVTALDTTRAQIGGTLTAAVDPSNVVLYWGPTDGGRDTASWKNKAALGSRKAGDALSAEVTGTPLETVYCRWSMTNAKGSRWSDHSLRVQLAGPPTVKARPPTLRRGSAIFRCDLATNGAPTTLTLAWGLKAGGDSATAGWEKSVTFAQTAGGGISTNLPLPGAATVHYRWFAENRHGVGASEAASFITAGPARAGDITFFSVSDTHFTVSDKENRIRHYPGIEIINTLAGKTYPEEVGGGVIDVPRGVVVLGDLIDSGGDPVAGPKQWAYWLEAFGLTGDDGAVAYPVYEGFGNHDLSGRKFVQQAIIERNPKRVTPVNVSTNGLHYSWDWDQLHLVQLNLFPGEVRGSPRYGPAHNPEYSLAFLKDDLEQRVGKSGRPVFLMHHFDLHDDWWTEEQRDKYYEVIKDYNVVAIVYGHTGTGVGKWHGIDWINDGQLESGVFVFNVTPNELRAAYYETRTPQWSFWKLRKPITIGDWKPPAK